MLPIRQSRGGPLPRPKLRLNPALAALIHERGVPMWKVTYAAGLRHASQLSRLLHEDLADTPTNRAYLARVADAIGFDQSKLFLDGDEQ